MKIAKITTLVLLAICFSQTGVFAFGQNKSTQTDENDIVIPSIGVTLDENGKPNTWISVPKHLRSKGTTVQSDDTHIYLEPKQKPGLIREMFRGNEGVNFQIQQPSIKVGGQSS